MKEAYSSLKAAWHFDRIRRLRQGQDIVPVHLHLVLSDLCNQDCHFCAYRMSEGFSTENFPDEKGNRNPRRTMPTAKAMEILEDAARLGVKAIEFTGGGEPTVHPDSVAIIERAQQLGLRTGLVTNAVLLEDYDPYRNLDWIRVSLDAASEMTYERTRASRYWWKVLDNIEMASRWVKPYVGVGFVITRENFHEIIKATSLVRELGARYIRLSAMFSKMEDRYYPPDILHEISRHRLDAKVYETDAFKVVDLFGDRIEDLRLAAPDYKFCGEQQFVLYIGGDQKIYTCCTNAYTTHGEIGNLREQSFAAWMTASAGKRQNFDARSCHHCQFNDKNRLINYLTGDEPMHVDFV